MSQKLYGTADLARAAGITVIAVNAHIRQHKLRAQMVSHVYVITEREAQRWLTERGIPADRLGKI